MKANYNSVMKEILESIPEGVVPNLLLHSCCGPCSTEVISRLTEYFNITVLYYNPNIEPKSEYEKRKKEQIRFINEFTPINKLEFMDCDYANEDFKKIAEGFEKEPEGGTRCSRCYELRLRKTGELAKENGFDYFCTTLTISPYKHSLVINQIAERLEKEIGVKYLYSDFKKEDGYKKSLEYSKEYNLYRQDYCGCHYSQAICIEE